MKKIIGWVVWLLMVIGSINWGLTAMGRGLFQMHLFVITFPQLVTPIQYLVGLAGIASVIMFLMGMFIMEG